MAVVVVLLSFEQKPKQESPEQLFLIALMCGKTFPASTTLILSITVNTPVSVYLEGAPSSCGCGGKCDSKVT